MVFLEQPELTKAAIYMEVITIKLKSKDICHTEVAYNCKNRVKALRKC